MSRTPGGSRTRGAAGYGGPGGPGYGGNGGTPPTVSGRDGRVPPPPPGRRGPAGRGRSTGPGTKRPFIDYPRTGRTGWRRWVPSWKLVGSLALSGAALVVLAFFLAYASTPIPDGKLSATFQTSTVYAADGSVIGRFAEENRTLVTIDKVPIDLQHAVYSAEDRTFEKNSGISITGMVRALLNNAQGGSLQGGSTITQQYVKNYYLSADRTYSRKVKELFISLKVGRRFTKPQILEGYLNTIYFGRGANGIQAAAKVYFGKSVDKLTTSESIYLAGIINGPNLYDPWDDDPVGKGESTKAAKARWTFVRDGMVAEGWLTADQAAKLRFPDPKKDFIKFTPATTPHGWKGYLLQMVRKEAASVAGLDAKVLDTGGYDIYTTFDPKLMDAATKSVDETLPDRTGKGLQVALSSIDVKTGEIRAIYGGDDYLQRQRNSATQDIAPAGSTFKPFTLLAALQGTRNVPTGECRPTITDSAISLDSRFDGHSPRTFDVPGGGTYKATNFGNEQFGMIDLRRATEHSVNTVFVDLNNQIGAKQTMNAAVCAGLPESTQDLQGNLANVLGSAAPHPIEMAGAYATIANNGRRMPVHGITKILKHQDKKSVYKFADPGKQVFDPNVTANAIEAMQKVVQGGTGTYASRLGRPVAGKTGTSSDNLSAWFVGFTPQVATSVAMYRIGKDGGQEQIGQVGFVREVTGGSFPTQIWTDYMSRALDGVPVKDFPAAQPIGERINPAPSETPKPSATTTQTQTPTQTPTATPTGTPTTTPTDSPTGSPTVTTTPTLPPTPTRTRTRTNTKPPNQTVAAPATP